MFTPFPPVRSGLRLVSMLGQSHGFPVPVGGAGALTAALVSRLQHRDGLLRCAERVVSVVVRGVKAAGDVSTGASRSVRQRDRSARLILAPTWIDRRSGRHGLYGPDASARRTHCVH
ncbi:hypothetical protein [Streptomyces sp. Ag109_G2-15]|uniref:hypothetical protein n=1 Tax=Streptomyces sp. Ag109_G2-15 TaxID=1938850 RepID=UPI000BCCEA2C|nr:hypothetical protein SAMN06272765_8156 [Streptomyces sp. Ag109_G2-15]